MNYTDESQQVNGWLKNENTHVNTDNSKVNANLLTENKTLKDRIAELESLNRAVDTELDRVQPLFEKMKEVVNAVAYVGVDFGYGPYKLEASVIQTARILSENKQASDL